MVQDTKLLHTLTLENRENMTVSAVCDVDTFDENKIVLFTEDDTLCIEGENLHIQKLDVANGELEITGNIFSLTYTGRSTDSRGKGFFRRIMK
ncbi:MAG: sporulation protein YabP [Clostridia bacterium]|nr:sporulation protein YabP [Clostridia bacterium]